MIWESYNYMIQSFIRDFFLVLGGGGGGILSVKTELLFCLFDKKLIKRNKKGFGVKGLQAVLEEQKGSVVFSGVAF